MEIPHVWSSSDVTWYPCPDFMYNGNGSACNTARVFPPGSESSAFTCNALDFGFCWIYLALACSNAVMRSCGTDMIRVDR